MIDKEKMKKLKEYFSTQPVDVVYLFGSQATGKANKLSDFDLGVLFREKLSSQERFDLKLEYSVRLAGILRVENVDIVDLKNAPLKFKYQAIFPKNTIIVKNRKNATNLEYDTTRKYLEFQPYLYAIAKRQLELKSQKGFYGQR